MLQSARIGHEGDGANKTAMGREFPQVAASSALVRGTARYRDRAVPLLSIALRRQPNNASRRVASHGSVLTARRYRLIFLS
jgi:hypothetical protein